MPSPINHRDITLTENGRGGALKYEHTVRVHLDTTSIVGGGQLPFTEVSTPGDVTRHALEILDDDDEVQATVFWDVECKFSGLNPRNDSAVQYRDPATGTQVSGKRPSNAALYDNNVAGGWRVKLYTWSTSSSGWTVNQTPTSTSDGMTWAITVLNNTATRYSGSLAITVRTASFLVLTGLAPEDLAKVYGIHGIKPGDLVPGPTGPGGGKKTSKKTAAKKKATTTKRKG